MPFKSFTVNPNSGVKYKISFDKKFISYCKMAHLYHNIIVEAQKCREMLKKMEKLTDFCTDAVAADDVAPLLSSSCRSLAIWNEIDFYASFVN